MATVEIWHRALAEPSRERLLEELDRAPDGLDVAELSHHLGLHANTVRWHLGVLVDAGLVEATRPRPAGAGRPPLVYRALERPAARDDYRLLASVLAASLDTAPDGAARAEAAGREWGRYLVERPPVPFARPGEEEAVGALVTLLDANGFAPERDDDRACVHMHRCPFRELAEQHGAVVCALHLGLVRGALAELRSPMQVERLDPFDEPGRCTAYLRPA
jgi:predicted ArsR family transcriptional regulator